VVSNHITPRNNPEDGIIQFNIGDNLRSHTPALNYRHQNMKLEKKKFGAAQGDVYV
jgi:hypothetical protein